MSATITANGKIAGVAHGEERLCEIICSLTGSFEVLVDGDEAIILQAAMRRYCEPLSKSAKILDDITPKGYKYDHAVKGGEDWDSRQVWVSVFFRRIPPPPEYEYTCGKQRVPQVGDWFPIGADEWVQADEGWVEAAGDKPRTCYRRVEVQR